MFKLNRQQKAPSSQKISLVTAVHALFLLGAGFASMTTSASTVETKTAQNQTHNSSLNNLPEASVKSAKTNTTKTLIEVGDEVSLSSSDQKTSLKQKTGFDREVESKKQNDAAFANSASNKRVEDILKALDQQQSRVKHLYQKQTTGTQQLAYNSALIKLKENSKKANLNSNESVDNGLLNKLNSLANNSIDKFRQTGMASWYGRQFQDKSLGAAQAIDMTSLTASHSSLPMSCYIKVTNEENGQSVVVQVNGRVKDNSKNIVDLSYAAAQKIGLTDSSKGKVSIERLQSAE